MIITAIFGLQRVYAQVTLEPHAVLFDVPLMEKLSACILVVTIVALYIVTVFKNFVEEGAATEMRSDEVDFLDEWKHGD